MRIRRILRVLVVSAGIVVVLLVAAMALLHTRVAKRLVLAQIQKFLITQDVAMEAADFDYSFKPLRVSTGRISVQKISSPDLPRFFQADHFTVSASLKDLIHGRYRIEDLQVENPAVHVVIDEQHHDNIPGASGKTATSSQPIDWLILKLRAPGGSFTLDDRSKNLFLRFPVWEMSLDASGVSDTEEFQFKTHEASEARFDGKTLSIDSMDAQGLLKQQFTTLDLRSLHLKTVLGDFAFSGTLVNLSDPQLNLSMSGGVHLKPVRQFLAITENIQGDVHVEAVLTGRPKALQLTGHLTGGPLAVDRFRDVAFDTDLALDLGTSRARLTSVRARSPNLSASGAADVAFTAEAGESRIDARFDVADLQRLLQLYKLPVSFASRVTGNAQVSWPGVDVGRLKGSGRIQLLSKSPVVTGKDIPVTGVVSLSTRGDRLTASIDELDSGALHLTGQINLQSLKQIGGAVRLEVSDTGQALPQVAG